MSPNEIPGLMPIPKIQPKKTKEKPITQFCNFSAVKLLKKVEGINMKEKEKKELKEEAAETKERLKEAFLRYKWGVYLMYLMWSNWIEAMLCVLQCPEICVLKKGICCERREASDVAAGPGHSHSRDNIKE